MMEIPKDYSCEDRASVRKLDGRFTPRRHRESAGGVDPNELIYKLQNLTREDHNVYAMHTLHQHYNSVLQKRKKPTYKVYLTYVTTASDGKLERETYIVRVERNTLREVKSKLPIKGTFRFFFTNENEAEEIEDEDLSLPYREKDGSYAIYCRLFQK